MRCLRQIGFNFCLVLILAYTTSTSLHQDLESSVLISSHYQGSLDSKCEIYKVIFNQHTGQEHVQYQSIIPELEQYTICLWTKLETHDRNHPLFSYTGWKKCEICSWVINSKESSYLSMTVSGHTLFRLNYPLKLRKWYHICESWNGKTGEWQVWVNAERVGRGFYNRLVGYKIPAGGEAISGQEQKWKEPSGDIYEGEPKDSDGMVGQITMVQLYKVALTAGKAHRNHKHHHAHRYDHHGNQITTTPSTKVAQKQPPQTQMFVNDPSNSGKQLNLATYGLRNSLVTVAEDPLLSEDIIFASGNSNSDTYRVSNHHLLKRQTGENLHEHEKRETLIAGGSILEDAFYGKTLQFEPSFSSGSGSQHQTQEEEPVDNEPAEAEVRAIMNVCSGCDAEPFGKALIIGWRNTSKIIASEANYVRAINKCGVF